MTGKILIHSRCSIHVQALQLACTHTGGSKLWGPRTSLGAVNVLFHHKCILFWKYREVLEYLGFLLIILLVFLNIRKIWDQHLLYLIGNSAVLVFEKLGKQVKPSLSVLHGSISFHWDRTYRMILHTVQAY